MLKLKNDRIITFFGNILTPSFWGQHNNYITHRTNPNASFWIRPNTADWLVIFETWVLKPYGITKLNKGDIALDLGANIGDFSIFLAITFPNIRIYSFEPLKSNRELFVKNILLNKIKNIVVSGKAVSGKSGQSVLFVQKNNGAIASLVLEDKKNRFRVQTTTLNDIIKENKLSRIDYLKIDVEGAEYEILFKTKKENLEKIKYLTIEVHKINGLKYHPQMLVNFLQKNGFKVSHPSKMSVYWLLLGTMIINASRP
jgi:FkbM family methyltransferase